MAVSDVKIQDLALSNGWDLISLPIPVPPSPLLERAVGYQREQEARFLALWWEPCGDEVMVSDGYISFTGHWPGYLTYVQHPRIYPHLAATTWLVRMRSRVPACDRPPGTDSLHPSIEPGWQAAVRPMGTGRDAGCPPDPHPG